MKKVEILSLSALIFFVVAGQISLSFASLTSERTITASGTIIPKLTFLQFINAWGLSYPVSQDLLKQMAKFDLITTSSEIKEDAQQIKQLNPNALILDYKDVMGMNSKMEDWSTVNQHEDWFVHDIHGNRLVNKDWGWYCMDVGNQGWRQHFADFVKQKLSLYSFDGVFADDVWSQFWKDGWTVPSGDIPDYPDWHQKMIEFIKYVKSQIGSKLLIINGPNNTDYVDAADGKVGENFLTMFDAWSDINALATISTKGKYYLAWAKGSDTLSNMLYFLSGYLLGVNGSKAFFGWNNIWSESKGYYPEFDAVELLGDPTNKYYSYQSVYARDFKNGKVLFNPSGNTYTVDLQGTYITLSGATVTKITMGGYSGAILKKG